MNKQNKDFINYYYSVKLYEMIPKKAYDNIEEIQKKFNSQEEKLDQFL